MKNPLARYQRQLRKQAKEDHGMIYFIEAVDTGLVKIGFSMNPRQRFQVMLTTSPVPLRWIGEMLGGPSVEQMLHDRFSAHRSHGEWFRRSPEMDALIAEYARADPLESLAGKRLAPPKRIAPDGLTPRQMADMGLTITGPANP